MDTSRSSFISRPWTNEKHLRYLKSMEASFVRTMFESNGRLLRLDRYVPDTSDSTLDLKTHQRIKKHAATSAHDVMGPKTGMASRSDKRFTRRPSYQPYASSQDQVVPQIGNRRGDKDESDPVDAPTK